MVLAVKSQLFMHTRTVAHHKVTTAHAQKLSLIVSEQTHMHNGLFQKRSIPPPHGGNLQYPPPPLRTSYTNLRHFLDNPYLPLSGRRKFPLCVGYRSFLEQPNTAKQGKVIFQLDFPNHAYVLFISQCLISIYTYIYIAVQCTMT